MTVYDEDRLVDARREAWDELHPPDTECAECGFEWWGNWDGGSQTDPPEPRNADCPNCNSREGTIHGGSD